MNKQFSFMSSYPHTLDDKGRLALPGKLRDELQKSERPDELVALASEEGYVTLFPHEQWQKLEDDIRAIEDADERDAALDFFVAKAERLTLDKAGRLLLPGPYRKKAGLDREVTVKGKMYKIQIEPRSAQDDAEAPEPRRPKSETIKRLYL